MSDSLEIDQYDTLPATSALSSNRICESTGICVDTRRCGINHYKWPEGATVMLFAAMIEWGQQHNLQAIATVTEPRRERILRGAGWHLGRLGMPRQIGSTKVVAGLLPITNEALGAIRAAGQISGCAIDAPPRLAIAA